METRKEGLGFYFSYKIDGQKILPCVSTVIMVNQPISARVVSHLFYKGILYIKQAPHASLSLLTLYIMIPVGVVNLLLFFNLKRKSLGNEVGAVYACVISSWQGLYVWFTRSCFNRINFVPGTDSLPATKSCRNFHRAGNLWCVIIGKLCDVMKSKMAALAREI